MNEGDGNALSISLNAPAFYADPIPPGILPLPEIADGFSRLIQPVAIREQRDQFRGAKKLYRVRLGPTQAGRAPRRCRALVRKVSADALAKGAGGRYLNREIEPR